MSIESAYNKRLSPDSTYDKIEAVLEHLNLPQPVLGFIRRHVTALKWGIILLTVGVVSFSLWSSWHEREIQNAASALAVAAAEAPEQRAAALDSVIDKYGSTTSGTWAKIEMAHLALQNGKFAEAVQQYAALQGDVSESNPLFPLLVYGEAKAQEAAKKYDAATELYKKLQDIKGFQFIGFSGEGEVLEQQGQKESAIAVYNDFVVIAGDDPALAQDKAAMESKITQVKAVLQ